MQREFFFAVLLFDGLLNRRTGSDEGTAGKDCVPLSCCRADEEATESDRQTINFGVIANHSLVTAMDEALKTLGSLKKTVRL